MEDPVNVFFCFIGLLLWPELTFCVILWLLGHPFLGIMALCCGSSKTITKYIEKSKS